VPSIQLLITALHFALPLTYIADQSLDYSTHVFSLGVLLSSMLIFNQMGIIDESMVDKLSNVCEFSKLIKSKAGAKGKSAISAPGLCLACEAVWAAQATCARSPSSARAKQAQRLRALSLCAWVLSCM